MSGGGTGTGGDVTSVPNTAISFDLPDEISNAIKQLSGGRSVRLSGEVRENRLVVDAIAFPDSPSSQKAFIAVNAPFITKHEIAV